MTDSQKPREYFLSRGNEWGPNELTHICLFEYHADRNPLVLVEKSDYDLLIKDNTMLETFHNSQLIVTERLVKRVRELESVVEKNKSEWEVTTKNYRALVAWQMCRDAIKAEDI